MAGTGTFTMSPTEKLRVGEGFRLDDVDPSAKPGFEGKKEDGKAALKGREKTVSDLQERLFADSRFGSKKSVLLILQGMDTSGKGGVVRHVVGAADPQGVEHHAFKAPTEEEKDHGFLWRVEKEIPGYGIIGVFDRYHYEDVLIHKVHKLSPEEEIGERYDAINDFESGLVKGGMSIIKLMLHIGRDEQKDRLMERLDRPDKHWKYSPGDLEDRALWSKYQEAYQTAIERTNTEAAPWYVVPADRKWYARLAVQQLLIDVLEGMDLKWPKATFDVEEQKAKLAKS
ncbi:PPK2 family polyphosphate kinase [Arthrobacter sp. H14]|uniref:PPK2 family polyphosphate kinase n=1 Tax=Arthrobacter sp. H14 TaxID=1312959 RepID=UPI00047B9D05|nr:PPK2 family polyphosphate kinase [Arthrobacter sp. H14]